ncbi:MAG: segregation/condensation protein A [Roseofilum sp. SBFL]|nr:segregation/condensation protein A [Roseofilum sp. SID3]MBP0023681.1 segregation/condensation protein A [Roseofilum sp. SID2]MBP0036085.1 segregation/condensation protein A [Roseofilum sp. SID1]MBP0041677.1 segregation/condensation protein A [Roseofilum sp. SBFL]
MGISLLIEMAQRGEIDPWDVQVIDVIDRVLEQLNARAAMTPEDQSVNRADLSESGQVFLYASMLVLLKAESLEEDSNDLSPEDLAAEMEDYDDRPDGNRPRIPFRLENQLRRRAIARPLKQRRVTLQELIDQLQTMSQTLADRSEKSPRRRALSRAQTAKAIRQLAHEENLSEVAEKLEKFLSQYGSVEEEQPEWLELNQLLVSHPQCDRVGTFWGLLLLSAQSKVELKQEEFYQDLKIRVLGELSPA